MILNGRKRRKKNTRIVKAIAVDVIIRCAFAKANSGKFVFMMREKVVSIKLLIGYMIIGTLRYICATSCWLPSGHGYVHRIALCAVKRKRRAHKKKGGDCRHEGIKDIFYYFNSE